MQHCCEIRGFFEEQIFVMNADRQFEVSDKGPGPVRFGWRRRTWARKCPALPPMSTRRVRPRGQGPNASGEEGAMEDGRGGAG